MNTLESTITASPNGVDEECALFKIDDTSNPFVFNGITTSGEKYTLTIWVKSTANKSMVAAGATISVTSKWVRHIITYTAKSEDLLFQFKNTGNYYIYHAKLETGNVSTDWTPAPEDNNAEFDSVDQELQVIRESVAQLSINADGIVETVSKTEESINKLTGEVEATNQELLEIQRTSNQLTIDLQNVTDNGVDRVTTSTGFTFNETGMTVSKSASDMTTQITEDGMKVTESGNVVLSANHDGVEAKDLHARTYLIVGGRSRFENYGTDRTGCFWISEE